MAQEAERGSLLLIWRFDPWLFSSICRSVLDVVPWAAYIKVCVWILNKVVRYRKKWWWMNVGVTGWMKQFSNLLFLVWLLDIQKSATGSSHRRSISSLKWRSSGWVGCKVSCRGNYLQAKMDQIACPMRSDSRMCSREFTDQLIHQSFLLGLIPQPVRAKNPQLYLHTTLPSTLKK